LGLLDAHRPLGLVGLQRLQQVFLEHQPQVQPTPLREHWRQLLKTL
jgi:hypothetical protein